MIKLKRAYAKPSKSDGTRILVERLWPRGLSKDRAQIDLWLRDIAPSPELRKWYGHDPSRWTEFRRRYRNELKKNRAAVENLKRATRGKTVTFVYAARDEAHNSAVVLKAYLSHNK